MTRTTADVVDEIVNAVPELRTTAREVDQRWAGDPPPTLIMSALGKAYVQTASQLSPLAARQIFDIVDAALAAGDDVAKDAVATGLLEAVVAESKRRELSRSEIVDRYLGPLAKDYLSSWDEWNNTT